MDAIVTARVPVEVKEQANAILKELGSSPTKLINAAYDYLLATHKLPTPRVVIEYSSADGEPLDEQQCTVLRLTEEQREQATAAALATKLPNASTEQSQKSFEELLANARGERYASLA